MGGGVEVLGFFKCSVILHGNWGWLGISEESTLDLVNGMTLMI